MKNNKRIVSYWNAILLAFLGGIIGLQEFYVRRYILGIFAMLFSWTCVPAFVALIEAFYWLFIGENEFNKTHNNPQIEDVFE